MKTAGRVEKLVAGGYGLIRDREGVIFCRAAAPGELVEAVVTGKSGGVRWAEISSVLEPASARVASACPYFPLCGGCDFQHLEYADELEAKKALVRETIRRVLRREVPDAGFSPLFRDLAPLGYRNTVSLNRGEGRLGYRRKKSRRIVPIADCLLGRPVIREEIGRRRAAGSDRLPLKLTLRSGNVPGPEGREKLVAIADYGDRRGIEGGAMEMDILGRRFRVGPDSFFQINAPAAGVLAQDLREELLPGGRLLDLFAGVGFFALILAESFDRVLGFEISPSALMDFRHNRRGAGRVEEKSWDAAGGIEEPIGPGDTVLVDPPRGGLPQKLLSSLCRSRPRFLAYVSCHPAALARDLGILFASGFGLAGPLRFYDMFPRTAHVEVLALLKHRA